MNSGVLLIAGVSVFIFLCGVAWGGVKLTVALTSYFAGSRAAQESTAESNQGIRKDLAQLGLDMRNRFSDIEGKVADHGERIVVLEDFKRRTESGK